MKYLLLIFIIAVITKLSTCYTVSHFKICASDHLPNSRDYACQISRFNTDVKMPATADNFFDCCFITSHWMDRGSKELRLDKLMRDMTAIDDIRMQTKIKRVVSYCRTVMEHKINARAYFQCLITDPDTKGPFKAMLKKQESGFFNNNYCNSG